jgi:hypothetical protein
MGVPHNRSGWVQRTENLFRNFRLPSRCWLDLRSSGAITQRRVVILYRRLGTTYRSHLQGSRYPRRKSLTYTWIRTPNFPTNGEYTISTVLAWPLITLVLTLNNTPYVKASRHTLPVLTTYDTKLLNYNNIRKISNHCTVSFQYYPSLWTIIYLHPPQRWQSASKMFIPRC